MNAAALSLCLNKNACSVELNWNELHCCLLAVLDVSACCLSADSIKHSRRERYSAQSAYDRGHIEMVPSAEGTENAGKNKIKMLRLCLDA